MKYLIYFGFFFLVLSCSREKEVEATKKTEVVPSNLDSILDGDTLHLVNRKGEIIERFNKISAYLKLQRLDSTSPTPNYVKYRVTLLSGPHSVIPYQGVCFQIEFKGPTSTLKAYHFGFDKNASIGKPFQLDTVLKTVIKDFSKERDNFEDIIRGIYLEDHIEFNENHMSTGPTYFCIEKHNMWYKRVIKENIWPGNFQDLVDLCFKTADIKFVKNYR